MHVNERMRFSVSLSVARSNMFHACGRHLKTFRTQRCACIRSTYTHAHALCRQVGKHAATRCTITNTVWSKSTRKPRCGFFLKVVDSCVIFERGLIKSNQNNLIWDCGIGLKNYFVEKDLRLWSKTGHNWIGHKLLIWFLQNPDTFRSYCMHTQHCILKIEPCWFILGIPRRHYTIVYYIAKPCVSDADCCCVVPLLCL